MKKLENGWNTSVPGFEAGAAMAKLVYGLYRYTVNENGIDVVKEELRHVDKVERGLACNCFCPDCECNGRLEARQGDVNEHHFAHHKLDECEYGYRIGITL